MHIHPSDFKFLPKHVCNRISLSQLIFYYSQICGHPLSSFSLFPLSFTLYFYIKNFFTIIFIVVWEELKINMNVKSVMSLNFISLHCNVSSQDAQNSVTKDYVSMI